MTKMRQLPITDLARIATMEPALRREALEQVKGGGGGGSYRPTREKLPDIVNRQPGVFESERAPWAIVEKDLLKMARSEQEAAMNKVAGQAIYDYCVQEQVKALELEGYPLTFSVGLKLTCWSPALFLYPDRISVPFFDMRRRYFLTPKAVKFMFSVMDIALRQNNPNYEEVSFEILRLADSKERIVRVIAENEMTLFSYEELEDIITATQNLWIDVQLKRRDGRRGEDEEWGRGTLFG